jgi:hypothetical protein
VLNIPNKCLIYLFQRGINKIPGKKMGEVTLNLRVGGSGGGPKLPVGEKKPESLSPDLGKPKACVENFSLAMGQGIDSRNRVWN